MGLPPAEQCGETEGVRTDTSLTAGEQHPKDPSHVSPSLCEGDHSTSWFVCETRSQLRILLEVVPHARNSFRHLTTVEKPIDIDVREDRQEREFHLEEVELSVEEQNNAEASSTPATHSCLELNAISTADQAVPCSVQPNDIEAQKALESVIKIAPVQEFFERKLSKTWKQECTTYDDLNKNNPSLSPHGDQSQNFVSSGFVKAILALSRKKLNMTLDVSSIANCKYPCMDKPNVNHSVDSLEIQERECMEYSSPEEEIGTVKDCCKGKAISKQQQKVAPLQFRPTNKRRSKRKQKGRKDHRSSRLRGDQDSCSSQATKSEEQGTFRSLERCHLSDSGLSDEPSDADSSTPQQQHPGSPAKQGNSSGISGPNKGAGRVFHKDDGGVGEGTGDKDDDEERPPGKDGESHIDITALQQNDAWKRRRAGHLGFRVPDQEMPPEVLRDETGDQAPSDFNLKPPPPPNQLPASPSASASGVGGNADAALLSDPRKKLQVLRCQRLGTDSGFSSGPSPQAQVQPVEQLQQDILDIPRRKPAWIACPESSRFHLMVSVSLGIVDGESATDDPSAVTTDTTFDPGLQQLAPLQSRLSGIKSDVTPPYNSLEYFDRENKQQDNVLGLPYTPFVSTAEQHLGGYVVHNVQRPYSAHGDQNVDSVEGLLDFQQYPTQESGSQRTERTEMVGCIAPFLPTGVVCSPPLPCAREHTTVELVNSLNVLLHANFESRIVGILSSPDLHTFTSQSDMFVPSIEPLVS